MFKTNTNKSYYLLLVADFNKKISIMIFSVANLFKTKCYLIQKIIQTLWNVLLVYTIQRLGIKRLFGIICHCF